MTYKINEIFLSLQGEGYWTGTPSVFVRFSGCNFWNGREKDKAESLCPFCDTDFVNGKDYNLEQLIREIKFYATKTTKHVVLTGGEPTLQMDQELCFKLKEMGYYVAVETNGSNLIDHQWVDWITFSPKSAERTRLKHAHEIKVLWPTPFGCPPQEFYSIHWRGRADHCFVQPIDNEESNIAGAVRYCLATYGWRLSLQAHKILGMR